MKYCINRNIVECKVCSQHVHVTEYRVLIETLWNVKCVVGHPCVAGHPVLIETLWNVKISEFADSGGAISINRNIVECKVHLPLCYFKEAHRINRNIVECKVSRLANAGDKTGSINRNIVECKGRNKIHGHTGILAVLIETLWNVKST